jgi:hypothetical protein
MERESPESKPLPLPVNEELVRRLDEMIPERCPELSWSDREIWHYRGMRQVVRLLIKDLKELKDVQ